MMNRLAIWAPPQLTPWQLFVKEPAAYLARQLRQWRPAPAGIVTDAPSNPITVVCISDTHLLQPEIPDGDLLLHAGDMTNNGSFEELQSQLDWLASLPHKHKVVIAGNHDRLLDAEYVARHPDRICEDEGRVRSDLKWHDLIYLDNSSVTLDFPGGQRLRIYGSPQTPQCGDFAFQYPPIRDVWTGVIPSGTDVLLSHGPPRGHLDLGGKGCPNLAREVARARPRLVVFGHIHAGRGRDEVDWAGLERCYQKVMFGDSGLAIIPLMGFWLATAWLSKIIRYSFGLGRGRISSSTMVNTAVAGGVGDEMSPVSVLTI